MLKRLLFVIPGLFFIFNVVTTTQVSAADHGAGCPDLLLIPATLSPDSGNSITDFVLKLKWSTFEGFQDYQTKDVIVEIYKNDGSKVTTSPTIISDSVDRTKYDRQFIFHIPDQGLTPQGANTNIPLSVKLNIQENGGSVCTGYEASPLNIRYTAKGVSAGVKPRLDCSQPGVECTVVGIERCTIEALNNAEGMKTAIGCVPTEPKALIQGLLKFATGIGGGIALLLMISGTFRMITSAGNPDSLKAGHEQITSAVIGLLFIIFSVLFLQIIGVDILGIEALKP